MSRPLDRLDYEVLRAAARQVRLEDAETGRERPRKVRRRPRDPEKIALLRMICEDYRRHWPPRWWKDETGRWCARLPRLEALLAGSPRPSRDGDGAP